LMQCRSDPQSRASLYLAVSCGEECSGLTHFTEELSYLSESDKDWVMGRAILARLKWA
jgi:hypothetical protein